MIIDDIVDILIDLKAAKMILLLCLIRLECMYILINCKIKRFYISYDGFLNYERNLIYKNESQTVSVV